MISKLAAAWRQGGRRLRWMGGRGWRAEDFARRYAQTGDVWGYRASPEHNQRAEWILAALPRARFARALEVGCAQGFLTERLALRASRLVACDFSQRAVTEARRALAHIPHVELRVADIRAGFPEGELDLCLFSDVLYYLSKRETDLVLAEAARQVVAGGFLLIANEWRAAAGLTAPDYGFDRLDADPAWTRVERTSQPFGSGEFQLGLYRRRGADETLSSSTT